MDRDTYRRNYNFRCSCGHEGAVEEVEVIHDRTPDVSHSTFTPVRLSGQMTAGDGDWLGRMNLTCPSCGRALGLNEIVT